MEVKQQSTVRMVMAVTAFLGLALALVLAAIQPAARATHITPIEVDSNANCEGLTGIEQLHREENPSNGSADVIIGDETYAIVWDIHRDNTFDWSTSRGLVIRAVFVKGGSGGGGNLYDYRQIGGETSDSGLHALLNPSGTFAGLSHISFCGDVQAPTTSKATTTTRSESTTTTSTTILSTTTSSHATTTTEVTTTTTAGATTTSVSTTTTTTSAPTTTTMTTTTDDDDDDDTGRTTTTTQPTTTTTDDDDDDDTGRTTTTTQPTTTTTVEITDTTDAITTTTQVSTTTASTSTTIENGELAFTGPEDGLGLLAFALAAIGSLLLVGERSLAYSPGSRALTWKRCRRCAGQAVFETPHGVLCRMHTRRALQDDEHLWMPRSLL